MKRFIAITAVVATVFCALFALCACNTSRGGNQNNDFKGAMSQQSYNSEEDAVKGFLENEISGQATTARLLKYEEQTAMSSTNAFTSMLSPDEQVVSVKQVQVTYARDNVSAVAVAAAETDQDEQYYVYTVYIIVISKYGTSEYTFKYYIPAANYGTDIPRSYFESVLDPDKYTNCVQVFKTVATSDFSGYYMNTELNYTVLRDGNKMLQNIQMTITTDMPYNESPMSSSASLYYEYDETDNHVDVWMLVDGQYEKVSEAIYGEYGITSTDDFVSMNMPDLDYSFFEKTDYGFKLRPEFLNDYLAKTVNENLGSLTGSYITDVDATLKYYVNNGVVEKMVSTIDYGVDMMSESAHTKQTITVEFKDFGSTVVNRPLGISD